MGDPKGFLKIKRKVSGYRPVEERVNDYSEVEILLSDDERRQQAARCMDCGVPFCHWACPVSNVMPEWQDRLYRNDWAGAWAALEYINPFPEFTGRVCPALCEASCVLGANDEPVTIRQNELAIIEKAYDLGLVVPRPPRMRNGKKVAVVGAGPAGLSAAYFLNRAGFSVTVYEGAQKLGGYLRYGIPDFKLDKSFIDRRVSIMEAEGVEFRTGARIGSARYGFGAKGADGEGGEGKLISAKELESSYDLVLLTIGAREPRDVKLPGRENSGIVQALDFLSLQNRILGGENTGLEPITAYGKRVVVIGGGDTGSDCVGTANRQGAMRVTQIEVLPKPPEHRSDAEPWPLWPKVLKTSSSHLEGGERLWSVNTKAFVGRNNKVEAIQACRVDWAEKDGRQVMTEVPGSDFEIGADLVLLAMGFTHVVQNGAVADFELELDERGNIRTKGSFHTSNPKVWAAGDSRNGASLVVRAIDDGKAAAEAIIKTL
ncbi:glutamate synthase [NADH] (nadh-gogat) [Treponema primitia ZAS-2]|uniref:Glutamate synthase [NADH] (Nadh-gogat) n=1 Tax=Treponema primitia (strain ATCC BAA-887 / DSM 12427 / ZAS-2) TaxID=545694 RepID=F5YJ04_TREPZ|nr:glutamate synthase subunit beta [Treponema primitia]AEF84988.1 glutamate synthase [NADH] (nadh-gogat) [Treponema primitia ZAS-2]